MTGIFAEILAAADDDQKHPRAARAHLPLQRKEEPSTFGTKIYKKKLVGNVHTWNFHRHNLR